MGINSSIIAGTTAIQGAENDVIELPTSNAEVAYTISEGVKSIVFKSRSQKLLKLSFAVNGTSTQDYWTIYPGMSHGLDNLIGNEFTIYFSSPFAGNVVEVIKYS